MNMNMDLQLANRYFRAGDYKAAIEIYSSLRDKYPELKSMLEFNIVQAKNRLSDSMPIYVPKITGSEDNKLNYSACRVSQAYLWVSKEIESCFSENKLKESTVLVSIIVPVRNGAAFIEQTLESLRKQTHRNIEILVVDDFSDDRTGMIVVSLSRQDRRIKYIRLNANLGTYFARSYGISMAKGDYVTFHDADDFSHEMRISFQLQIAEDKNAAVVTTNYVRFNPLSGNIVEFHGKQQHYGFITTFARKKIFSELGAFDLTTRGGDAEFSHRISKFVDKSLVVHIPCPTYLASDLPGSLSHSEINRAETNRNVALSFPRRQYTKNFQAISHTFKSKEECHKFFEFPMLRSPYKLPALLGSADLRGYKIVGCVCTIPSRRTIFETVFESIERQVDELYVYPDKYDSELPEFLTRSSKVRILSSQKYPGLRDGAKFLPLQAGLLGDSLDSTIVFTFDDDILYPPDYVHSMVQRLKSLDFIGIVGVHGVILNDSFQNFRCDRTVYHFKKELENDKFVDVLGTGTVAFRADLLHGKFQSNDIHPGMIDISLAVVCRRNLIPMSCVSRHTGWLKDLTEEINDTSLWDELVQDASPHTSLLKSVPGNVWGFDAIETFFTTRRIVFPCAQEAISSMFTLPIEQNPPTRLQVSFEKSCIYQLTVTLSGDQKSEGEISLINSIRQLEIYKRKLSNQSVGFLCNAAINKHVALDFSLLESENRSINITVNIKEVLDAALPKTFYHDSTSITACLATYPPREDCLADVIKSVLPQVDNLCIYLNRYETLPSSLRHNLREPEREKGIHFVIDYDGKPKASGKFRWLDKEGYIFTLDDDIIYPDDYFSNLIAWIEKYDRKAFIGVHGVVFEENVSSFHSGNNSSILVKYNFSEALSSVTQVHLIGTGTLAFHSSLIDGVKKELYELMNSRSGFENLNDECLALFARKNEIPLYLVPRKAGWLLSNKKMKYGIYEDHFNDSTLSTTVVELLSEGNPWPKIMTS